MPSILSRLLLLVLLGLDWAADPTLLAPAVEVFAGAWRSTENVCPSVNYQRVVRRVVAPATGPSSRERAPDASARTRPEPRARITHQFASATSRLYVFMSLRR
jgi:hypothetical protein